jgi:hypothetical protein
MPAGYAAMLVGAQIDGTPITNSTTQASIIPPAAKYTLPAGFLDVIGKKLRIMATGRISCVATTPGTLLFEVRFSPAGANVAVAATAAFNLNTTVKTNVTWRLDWDLTVRAIGASTSANFMHVALFQSEAIVGSAANTAGGNGSLLLPVSAPAVGTGFDSTAAQVVDLQAKFSVSTATTSITLHQYELWSDN